MHPSRQKYLPLERFTYAAALPKRFIFYFDTFGQNYSGKKIFNS